MMLDSVNWSIYFYSAYAIGLFSLSGWVLSLVIKSCSHAQGMWGLYFVLSAFSMALLKYEVSARALLVLALLTLWALRLSVYTSLRNWQAKPYQDTNVKDENSPLFWLKSLYLIFGLLGALAFAIGISLFGAIVTEAPINGLDFLATLLVLFGLYWEALADWQLSTFSEDPSNANQVLTTGLWRYCRHPNYFGECCIWWGFYFFSLAAGAWWAIFSPVLVTVLLLKVSGIPRLESTISARRPAYQDYIASTHKIIPNFPK